MMQGERRVLLAEGTDNVKDWSQAQGTYVTTPHLGGPQKGGCGGRGEAEEDRQVGSRLQRGSKVMF